MAESKAVNATAINRIIKTTGGPNSMGERIIETPIIVTICGIAEQRYPGLFSKTKKPVKIK
jgi:hypothetical protein